MRLRDSAIVTILLLGLSGCAGVQPRLGWMQPSTPGTQDSEGRPLSRLAFWRHHSADDQAASADETTLASRDEANSRPRLLRRLPVVSRFFKDESAEESYDLGSPATRYARGLLSPPANAVATTAPSPALAPSATLRPIQTTSANVPNTDRPASSTLRELTVDLAGNRPDVDAATVPVRNPAAMPPPLQNTPSTANIPAPPLAPATMPSLGPDNVPPPTAVPGPAPSVESPDLVPAPPSTPAAPAARPAAPESQPSPKPAATEPASPAPSVTSTPGPAWPIETPSVSSSVIGSAQSVVMPSAQGGYVSGGCESPCGAKCKIHKLCPLKKHKQMVASTVVLPSGQGSVSSCEATVPCKKECFLKKWLHHKSSCKLKGCKGCKSCAYCGEAPSMVSAQGPIVSSQW